MTAAATIATVTMTSHEARNETSVSNTDLAPTAFRHSITAAAPMVTTSGLPGLLPALDDVKEFHGIQKLIAEQPNFQPSPTIRTADNAGTPPSLRTNLNADAGEYPVRTDSTIACRDPNACYRRPGMGPARGLRHQ